MPSLLLCIYYNYQVFGSKGMLMSGNQRPTELTSFTATGSTCDVIKPSYAERYADSYAAAMQHFLSVVLGTSHVVYNDLHPVAVTRPKRHADERRSQVCRARRNSSQLKVWKM